MLISINDYNFYWYENNIKLHGISAGTSCSYYSSGNPAFY